MIVKYKDEIFVPFAVISGEERKITYLRADPPDIEWVESDRMAVVDVSLRGYSMAVNPGGNLAVYLSDVISEEELIRIVNFEMDGVEILNKIIDYEKNIIDNASKVRIE